MSRQREWPYKTVIASRSPKAKAHLTEADARRAVAVATKFDGTLREDVQVFVWGTSGWVYEHELRKGEVPPWKR